MDQAICAISDTETRRPIRSYPLRPDWPAFGQVWSDPARGGVLYAVKGAPEAVFDLCPLDERHRGEASEA
jgi:Ca2+-transporting ATPase